ncbi:MAG TPA: DUF6531 domain-containing protein, partial [Nannocystaceae bacterium]|nr:DUF6531 domain-containing protein [Nannocystaceae bacterium]
YGTILPLFPSVLIGGLPLRGGSLDEYAKPPEPRVRDHIAALRLGDRLRGPRGPGRADNQVAAAEATVTGDPIDVVTGRVLLSTVDAHLPGPLPIVATRHYSSAWSRRDLGLGHGWSLSLDQALWSEPGQIVVRVADGRELTFPIADDAERHHDPREGLTLVRRPGGAWDLVDRHGTLHRFAPTASLDRPEADRCALVEIADASTDHRLHFHHDPAGRLVEVRADGGRALRLRWDPRGHLLGLDLPDPERDATFVPHRAYVIDERDDLTAITDALGGATRLAYHHHRLIRSAEPASPAYHFEYEGDGHDARCVRAHGDGDLLPRSLTYDRDHGRTVVLEGDGGVTTYEYGEHLRVVAVTDAAGGRTTFEYDPLGRLAAVTDPLGQRARHRHDDLGRTLEVIAPDGATTRYEYAHHDAPIAATCPLGGRWTWRRDPFGRVVETIDPLGRLTRVARDRGLITRVDAADGTATELLHDEHGDLVRARLASGACLAWSHDRRGRLRVAIDARGNPRHFHHDLEGRLVRIDEPDGNTRTFEHDPADRLIRARDRHRDLELTWSGPGWLASRSEGGRTTTYERDREGRVQVVFDPSVPG